MPPTVLPSSVLIVPLVWHINDCPYYLLFLLLVILFFGVRRIMFGLRSSTLPMRGVPTRPAFGAPKMMCRISCISSVGRDLFRARRSSFGIWDIRCPRAAHVDSKASAAGSRHPNSFASAAWSASAAADWIADERASCGLLFAGRRRCPRSVDQSFAPLLFRSSKGKATRTLYIVDCGSTARQDGTKRPTAPVRTNR